MSLRDMLPKGVKKAVSSPSLTATPTKSSGVGSKGSKSKGDRGGSRSANFVPPPNHKFKKPSYAELKERKLNLVKGLKVNWNTARTKTVDVSERDKTIVNMLSSIQGQIHQVALRHDTSRVVQTILQFGSIEQRQKVLSELGNILIFMSFCMVMYVLIVKFKSSSSSTLPCIIIFVIIATISAKNVGPSQDTVWPLRRSDTIK